MDVGSRTSVQACWIPKKIDIIIQFLSDRNLVCTFDLQYNYLDKDDLWSGILSYTVFEVRSMYHRMLQSTPSHLMFRREMILNTPSIAESEYRRKHK